MNEDHECPDCDCPACSRDLDDAEDLFMCPVCGCTF